MKSKYSVLQAFWSSYHYIEGLTYWIGEKEYDVTEFSRAYEPSIEAEKAITYSLSLLECAKIAQRKNKSKMFITEYKDMIYELAD